jgi:hypothetical protein
MAIVPELIQTGCCCRKGIGVELKTTLERISEVEWGQMSDLLF